MTQNARDEERLLPEVQRACFKKWNDPKEPRWLRGGKQRNTPKQRPEWRAEGTWVDALVDGRAGRLYYLTKESRSVPSEYASGGVNFETMRQEARKKGLDPFPNDSRTFAEIIEDMVYKSPRARFKNASDEVLCGDLLRKLGGHLRTKKAGGWLAKAQKTLQGLQVDYDDEGWPRTRPLDNGPAVMLVQTLIKLAELPVGPNPDTDKSRRQDIMFRIAAWLGRVPQDIELAWATILCGVKPDLRPARINGEARPPSTDPRIWEIINAERVAMYQTLRKYGDQLPRDLPRRQPAKRDRPPSRRHRT